MKIVKYIVSSLMVLWVTCCVQATAGQAQLPAPTTSPSLFGQKRLGFGLALEYLSADVNLKIQPPLALSYIESQHSQTGKHFQVAPCIEFGTVLANDYYLGLLASWRYTGLTTKTRIPLNNTRSFNQEFKLNNYADILMKIGYKLSSPSMLYGLIGPTITNWSHASKQILNGKVVENNFLINKTSLGLGVGIGFEYLFKKNYALSIDYTYHLQSGVSKSQFMTLTRPVTGVGNTPFSGDVVKKVNLSFATVALRFTMFFNL